MYLTLITLAIMALPILNGCTKSTEYNADASVGVRNIGNKVPATYLIEDGSSNIKVKFSWAPDSPVVLQWTKKGTCREWRSTSKGDYKRVEEFDTRVSYDHSGSPSIRILENPATVGFFPKGEGSPCIDPLESDIRREEKIANPDFISSFFMPSASSFYNLPVTNEVWEYPEDYFITTAISGLSMIYSQREQLSVGIAISKSNFLSYKNDLQKLKSPMRFPFEKRLFNDTITRLDKYPFIDEAFHERRADLYSNVIDQARFITELTSSSDREEMRSAGSQTALKMMGDYR